MVYIGIDPGKSGGIAVIGDGLIEVREYTDDWLKEVCRRHKDSKCIIEKVGAMPGQGVVSMFNFGKSYGYILGVIEANGISYEIVPPQKWKKEFSVTGDKNTSIAVCKRLFPKVLLFRTQKCKKEHDGMAEALLMAEYGRRHM